MDQALRELGLHSGASEADIKSAYRKLALQCHPDRHLNSSPADAAAAAHRFKAITEAYDFLTNPHEWARSSYGTSTSASSSSSSSRAYHYNVNTDWSYSEPGSRGYTSTISRWEWWKRAARHGVHNMGHTLHASLAVVLIGGGLMFEYSHSAMWAARNKGKSFEEVQEAVRARKHAQTAACSSSSGIDAAQQGQRSQLQPQQQSQQQQSQQQQSQQQQSQQDQVYLIRSSWADGMRGRFVAPEPGDPVYPETAQPAAAGQPSSGPS